MSPNLIKAIEKINELSEEQQEAIASILLDKEMRSLIYFLYFKKHFKDKSDTKGLSNARKIFDAFKENILIHKDLRNHPYRGFEITSINKILKVTISGKVQISKNCKDENMEVLCEIFGQDEYESGKVEKNLNVFSENELKLLIDFVKRNV